jgi:gamma-glutamylcysteine synthetase
MHSHDDNFFNFALERSADIESHFKERSLSTTDRDSLIRQARDSLGQQRDLEAADSISFAEFLDDYFS